MIDYVHEYYSVFSYFTKQLNLPHSWWADKRVLDFGGNWGNVLRDPACTIKHENYHCLDVSKQAIVEGQKSFPTANWHHYNRWNFMYNHEGNIDEPFPDLGLFDVILSYSVLTIGTVSDMVDTINSELLPMLNTGGVLMNTYLSMSEDWPLTYFLGKRGNSKTESNQLVAEAKMKDYVYLVGKDSLITDDKELRTRESDVMLTFYRDDMIKNLFPTCEIRSVVLHSEHHCQKCMVFRN